MITTRDFRIDSARSGYQVLLRNKSANPSTSGNAFKTVLFVHGATYGSTDTFDYGTQGPSWMEHMATQGFDVWCLDLLGYGQSDRPREMDEPAANHGPLTDTAQAVVEVDHAVSHIAADRGIEKLCLIGYSWGSAICGAYTGSFPHRVCSLVLHGALWIEGLPPTGAAPRGLGAYRTVDVDSMMQRWCVGLEQEALDRIISEADRRRWCEHTASCDPTFESTGLLRAPTGVMQDFVRCRESGEDWYDPGLISAPVMIVVGELDGETTPAQGQQLFSRLTHAASKQLTVIGQGTHSLLLENNRHQLHNAVTGFLAYQAES